MPAAIRKRAFFTLGMGPRVADTPTVHDDQMGKIRPEFRRRLRVDLRLDPDRIGSRHIADAVQHTDHVRISGKSRNAERIAEHDVRALAADAGQLRQFVHRPRNLAAEIRHEHLRALREIFALVAVKSARLDDLRDPGDVEFRHRRRVGGDAEELFRNLVHPVVTALRREHDRAEQPERRRMVERAAELPVEREKIVVERTPLFPIRHHSTSPAKRRKLVSSRNPALWLFSGWNCAAKQRPFPMQAENGTMYSHSATVYASETGT